MTNDEYKQHFAVQLKYVVNELGPTAASFFHWDHPFCGPADVENSDHFPGNHRFSTSKSSFICLSGETGRMSWRF